MSRNDLTSSTEAALNLLEKRPEFGPHFFREYKSKDIFHELKRRGFFDPSKNPAPVQSTEGYSLPQWDVLTYLENITNSVVRIDDPIWLELIAFIKDVTNPIKTGRVDNPRTWWFLAKIFSKIPISLISLDDLGLVQIWLKSDLDATLSGSEIAEKILPRYLEAGPQYSENAVKLIEYLTALRWNERKILDRKIKEPRMVVQEYWLQRMFDRNAEKIGRVCGARALSILESRICEIVREKKDDAYNTIWRRAIDDHEQNTSDDAINTFISAFRDVLLGLQKENAREGRKITNRLLNHGLTIFHRIALNNIRVDFLNLRGEFFKFVTKETFLAKNLKHELYEVLKDKFGGFTLEEKDAIFRMICSVKGKAKKTSDKTLITNQIRAEWLSAISGQGYLKADRALDILVKVKSTPMPEHPGFDFFMTTRWGSPSPLTQEQILTMTPSNLVKFTSTFKEESKWNSPTIDGLAFTIQQAAGQSHSHFVGNLKTFKKLQPRYLQSMIQGIQGSIEKFTEVEIENVLSILKYVIDSKLHSSHDDLYLGSTCARLMNGLLLRNTSIKKADLDLIRTLVECILPTLKARAVGDFRKDPMSVSINSERGAALEIIFSLLRVKAKDLSKTKRLGVFKEYVSLIESELLGPAHYETVTLLFSNLPLIAFYDKKFVDDIIQRIVGGDDLSLTCAIVGYSFVSTLYSDLFRIMRKLGFLGKAIKADLKADSHQSYIHSLSLAYIYGVDSFKDKNHVLYELKQNKKVEVFAEVARSLWFLGNRMENKLKKRSERLIVEFISEMVALSAKDPIGQESLYANLALLINYVNSFTKKSMEYFRTVIPFSQKERNSTFVIEALHRLVNEHPKEVGSLYLSLLEKSLPHYPADKIIDTVDQLFVSAKPLAAKICDIYLERGSSLLLEVYKKHNS